MAEVETSSQSRSYHQFMDVDETALETSETEREFRIILCHVANVSRESIRHLSSKASEKRGILLYRRRVSWNITYCQ